MDYLQQFRELLLKTPKHCSPTEDCENCPYNTFLYRSKNCYLCSASSILQDCYYVQLSYNCRDCADSTYCHDCELCYECVDCQKCYNCNFCQDCSGSTDLQFCYDCRGCKDCFGCVSLRQKQFFIFNEPYGSREAYEAQLKKIGDTDAKFESLKRKTPRMATHELRNENCTGDYIYNNKNCFYCYNAEGSQDGLYLYDEIVSVRDCCDCTHITNSELCYDCGSVDFSYNCNSTMWCVHSRDCEYCYCLMNCRNCFMCTYIRNKSFWILNEQYGEKDYFLKVAEIKKWLREKGLYGQNLIYLALKDTPEVAGFGV